MIDWYTQTTIILTILSSFLFFTDMNDQSKIETLCIYYAHWGQEEVRASRCSKGFRLTMRKLQELVETNLFVMKWCKTDITRLKWYLDDIEGEVADGVFQDNGFFLGISDVDHETSLRLDLIVRNTANTIKVNTLVDTFLQNYGGAIPAVRVIDDWWRIGSNLRPYGKNPYWFQNLCDIKDPHKRIGYINNKTLLNVDAIVSLF